MFSCCLCGKSYFKKEDAVKCVNKCGRAAFDAGRFVHKKIHYSNPIHQAEIHYFMGAVYDDSQPLDDQINGMIDALINKGVPKNKLEPMRYRLLNSNFTDEEKKREFDTILAWFDQTKFCDLGDACSSNGRT